ncbi:MAG: TonB-dependent receptor [Pseudomonadota bacterium]|jgi:iron complex outermembrane receptor protein
MKTGIFALFGAASTLALSLAAGGAQAQDATASKPEAMAVVEEVIVTGSRIARRDYTAESPIVTLGQSVLQAQGPTSIENTLNQLPQFAATAGSTSASQAGGGRATANLRGLGPARTLVLLDGRRLQPSDPLGSIDLNTLAPSLIESVEVITGGASAIYGSDAIAGVVNFKLKRNFEGLELDAQYGETERGDGRTIDLAATVGGAFADDRGRVMLSASHMDRRRVNRNARAFFRDGGITSVLPSGLIYADAANLPSQAALNGVFAKYGVSTNVPRNATFSENLDGTLFTISTPILNYRFPADGPYTITSNGQVAVPLGEAAPLQQPLDRQTVFAQASYRLTDGIEAYGQVNYAHYVSNQTGYGRNQAITRDVYLPVTNPFLPADLLTIAASRPKPTAPLLFYFNTGRYSPDIARQTYNVLQGLGGLRGKLAAIDGSWDVFASYGRTEQTSLLGGYIDRAAFLSLVNAPDGGRALCEGGLNPLALTAPSAACRKLLLREMHESTTFKQTNAEANLQGRVLALPAGDLRFAAGLSYRKNSYAYSPDAARLTGTVLTTGLTNPTNGDTTSTEAFLELAAPLLRDLPLVRRLDLDLAYRYADYDTVGGVHTYKASGSWEINDAISLRGGYQHAIRAPSVGELFRPSEQSATTVGRISAGLGDPCDIASAYRSGPNAAQIRALCIANGVPLSVIDAHKFAGTSVQSDVAGNPDLKEETSDTYTAGLVWRSRFDAPLLRRLSASVDYYNIKLTDAIGLITGDVIAQRCFNGQGNANPTYDPANFYCKLIHRGPSGGFASITTPLLNLGGYRTSGVDLQIDWGADLAAFGASERAGAISLNLLVSRMDKYEIQTLPGGPFVNYAGTIGNAQISSDAISHPKWKTVTSLGYRAGPLDLSLRWRWVESMGNSANVGAATATARGVKAMDYFDLSGRYRLGGGVELRAGALNLADRQPPAWTGESATDVALYDMLGRRYYLGLNFKF